MIEWRDGDDHVLMTGTADFEYEGRFDPALFANASEMAVEVVTFGCRLNAFESVIRHEAEGAGLTETVVINSCAVTNEAVAQARQSIRRLKRDRPHARIVVTGCAAQTQSRMFAEMTEVDRVIGNDDKMRGDAWRDARTALDAGFSVEASEKIAVADIMAVKQMAPHLLEGFQRGLPRVFVQVQNGCDHRCTFCIIPYGRGNSRSVPMGAVVDQVRALVERGHAEIVLTGVDLTSYGSDLPGTPRLGQLTKQILRHVPELRRLRISSIDSIEADRDLLDVIAEDTRLMPHLHLSLQSGDDLILKRMKRRHSRKDAVGFCAQVRRLRPDIAFGADIIAGFPTETEEMFSRSQDLVEACDLTFLHVFPYSKRPGRRRQGCRRSGEAIKERARRLRDGEAASQAAGVGDWRDAAGADRERQAGRIEHFPPPPSAAKRRARCRAGDRRT
jgi:threonylcarbamoyladenosine tRNA methylthiotransferase MtaB